MLTSQNEVSFFSFAVTVVALYVPMFGKCLVTIATIATAADKVINLNFLTKPEDGNRVTHANLLSKPDFQPPLSISISLVHFLDGTDRHRLLIIAIYDALLDSTFRFK